VEQNAAQPNQSTALQSLAELISKERPGQLLMRKTYTKSHEVTRGQGLLP